MEAGPDAVRHCRGGAREKGPGKRRLMATLWRKSHEGRTYEVRSAGATVRLYTNGAFHSQYNPRRLLSGGVWDLLALPALFAPTPPRSVLLLGVGGGTAIHALDRLVAPRRIVGVELDPIHIEVARRHFHADLDNVQFFNADALDWIARQRARHDFVIDDLFVDAAGDPRRPSPVDETWIGRLDSRTARNGVLVQNHLSPAIARTIVSRHETQLRAAFESVLMFTMPHYENGVLGCFRQSVCARRARRRAIALLRDIDATAARKLKFSCRQLY